MRSLQAYTIGGFLATGSWVRTNISLDLEPLQAFTLRRWPTYSRIRENPGWKHSWSLEAEPSIERVQQLLSP